MDYFKELDTFNERINGPYIEDDSDKPKTFNEAINLISSRLKMLEVHMMIELNDIRKTLTFIEMEYVRAKAASPMRLDEDSLHHD